MQFLIKKAIRAWLKLDDTPASYSGEAGKHPKVNSSEDSLEFSTNTDTELADAVTKAHDRSHAVDSASDHSSTITENNLLDADANGLPDDSGVAVADVADAVTKKHTRSHALDSASDHSSTIVENNLIDADANGLPDDSGVAVADAADAVTKKHSANTDNKIIDADSDTYEDVEASADVDEIVSYVINVLARKIHDNGIVDFPKQSKARAYRSTPAQSIPDATFTKVALTGVSYDEHNEYDETTNYRFVATEAGYYLVLGLLTYADCLADKLYISSIYKNGAEVARTYVHSSTAIDIGFCVCDIVHLEINDYLELWTYHNTGVAKSVYGSSALTFMAIHKQS